MLAAVLGVGLLLQSVAVMAGTWGVGSPQERIPPAWTVVGGAANGPFRVLWLTGDVGGGLPPPAGDPQRRLESGPSTIRYALTDREGASVLDIGRPFSGPGPDHLELALREILAGTIASRWRPPRAVRHPFRGGRAGSPSRRRPRRPRCTGRREPRAGVWLRDLPELCGASTRREPRDGAGRPRDPRRRRPLHDRDVAKRARHGAPAGPRRVGRRRRRRNGRSSRPSTTRDGSCREALGNPRSRSAGRPASLTEGDPVRIRHGGSVPAKIEVALLAILWLAALWATRKPVAR